MVTHHVISNTFQIARDEDRFHRRRHGPLARLRTRYFIAGALPGSV